MSDEASVIARIAHDVRASGVEAGDILLVHASLRALGFVPGGAPTVIAGLQQALGPAGTLLMPALSYATVTPAHPYFDLTETPANVGVIAETFRRTPGVQRSLHPTHSVCSSGPATAALLAAHGDDRTPCGQHSPFRLLPTFRGKILMLGCGLLPNTSFHAIEELVNPPYLFGAPLDYTLVDGNGVRTVRRYTPHGFAGVRQRYDRIATRLTSPALRVGQVLAARVYLFDAAAMWEAALAALQADPYAFVEFVEESDRASTPGGS